MQPPLDMARRPVLLEATPPELRARVEDVRLRLGITGGQPVESDGRTSTLSERLLFAAYGLGERVAVVEP